MDSEQSYHKYTAFAVVGLAFAIAFAIVGGLWADRNGGGGFENRIKYLEDRVHFLLINRK